MSEKSTSRRSAIKSLSGLAIGLFGAAGTATADDDVTQQQCCKEHRVTLSVEPGEGTVPYLIRVPDADPKFDSIENGFLGDDNVTYNNTENYTEIDGNVKGGGSPYYDEVLFDGSLDDDDTDLTVGDARMRVEVDGEVYKGQEG